MQSFGAVQGCGSLGAVACEIFLASDGSDRWDGSDEAVRRQTDCRIQNNVRLSVSRIV